MHNLWLFTANVFGHWLAAMSGIVSFTLGIVEYFRKQKTEATIASIVAILFLIVAFDQAWQDEHRNAEVLVAQKSTLVQERDFWRQQSYEKDGALRALNQLLGQNYGVLASTQASLANLSNRLLDVTGPVPRKIDVMSWKIPPTYTLASIGKVNFWTFVVMTNKPISPTRGDLRCDADFTVVTENVLTHASSLRADYSVLSARSVHIEFVYPPVSPENPLIFFAYVKEGTNINSCSFTLN